MKEVVAAAPLGSVALIVADPTPTARISKRADVDPGGMVIDSGTVAIVGLFEVSVIVVAVVRGAPR